MRKRKVLCIGFAALMCGVTTMTAQVGINTETPDPSAVLDVVSTTGGVLIPRMTAAQRDAIVNPATGLEVFCTDEGNQGKYYYDGTTWLREQSVAVQVQAQIFTFADSPATVNANSATNKASFDGCNLLFSAEGCAYAQKLDDSSIQILQAGTYTLNMSAYIIRSTATTAATRIPFPGR